MGTFPTKHCRNCQVLGWFDDYKGQAAMILFPFILRQDI